MRTAEPVQTVVPAGLAGVDLGAAAAVILLGRERWWRPPSADLPGVPRALAAALRWLGVRDDLRVRRTAAGRPYLADPVTGRPAGPSVNISHSSGWLMVAVAATGSVGVDVQEEPADPWDRVERRWLHPDDCAMQDPGPGSGLGPADRRRAGFTRAWAIREARCKATGAGLAGFRTTDPVGPGTAGRCGGVSWRRLLAPPCCAAAVAWAGDDDPAGRPVWWCRLPDTAAEDVHIWTDAKLEAYS